MTSSSSVRGGLAEIDAERYYMAEGYTTFLPRTHDSPVDFVATRGPELLRVQVKLAYVCRKGEGRPYLSVNCTGTKDRRYLLHDFDELFIVSSNAGCWRIPWTLVSGKTRIILGPVDEDGKLMDYERGNTNRGDYSQWRLP